LTTFSSRLHDRPEKEKTKKMKPVSAQRRAQAPESEKTPGFPDPDILARTISFPSPPRSARGRRKNRGTSEAGKQLAVPILFNVMVASGLMAR
jgi:hypothetical protein